jgi:hypothetical protein
MKHWLIAAILVFPALSHAADITSAEEVVAAHVEALGGLEKIHAINGYIVHGTYNEGDLHLHTH